MKNYLDSAPGCIHVLADEIEEIKKETDGIKSLWSVSNTDAI